MKKSRKRKLSAIIILTLIILIIASVVIIKDRNLLSGKHRIYIIADNVAGLNAKDAVMIKGMEVGTVKEISFMEIKLDPRFPADKVQSAIASIAGDEFQVKNRQQQNAIFYRVMKSEKWHTALETYHS